MPAINNVTPVRATIHYDDVSRQWHLHASRVEYSSLGDQREMVKENFDTFAELLVLLLRVWVLSGVGVTLENTLAPIGDMSLLGAAVAALPTTGEPDLPEYPNNEFDADPRDLPVYDGVASDWGMAPAGP